MSEAERRDIERLVDEVSGLNEGIEPDGHSLVVDRQTYKMVVTGGVTRVERDPKTGMITRAVGPNKTTVVDRDEHGHLIGWHDEREDIVPE